MDSESGVEWNWFKSRLKRNKRFEGFERVALQITFCLNTSICCEMRKFHALELTAYWGKLQNELDKTTWLEFPSSGKENYLLRTRRRSLKLLKGNKKHTKTICRITTEILCRAMRKIMNDIFECFLCEKKGKFRLWQVGKKWLFVYLSFISLTKFCWSRTGLNVFIESRKYF